MMASSDLSGPMTSGLPLSAVAVAMAGHELLPGHSRNSSGTSHSGSGSASGYGSLASQSQHSRQSSSGELGHFRSVSSVGFFLVTLRCVCSFLTGDASIPLEHAEGFSC